MNDYRIYLLKNSFSNYTYIGVTNNFQRRIRQHNGDLVGGAKYTKSNKGEGIWEYYGWINNVDKHTALSLEKKIQIRSRKVSGKTPIERRLKAIEQILRDYNELYSQNLIFEINLTIISICS